MRGAAGGLNRTKTKSLLMISSVSSEQHLGHIIGNQVSQECIKSITNDFISKK